MRLCTWHWVTIYLGTGWHYLDSIYIFLCHGTTSSCCLHCSRYARLMPVHRQRSGKVKWTERGAPKYLNTTTMQKRIVLQKWRLKLGIKDTFYTVILEIISGMLMWGNRSVGSWGLRRTVRGLCGDDQRRYIHIGGRFYIKEMAFSCLHANLRILSGMSGRHSVRSLPYLGKIYPPPSLFHPHDELQSVFC